MAIFTVQKNKMFSGANIQDVIVDVMYLLLQYLTS